MTCHGRMLRPLAGLAAMCLLALNADKVVADEDDVVCRGCVDTRDIDSRAVTRSKIADKAVTKRKIADAAVRARHIAPGQVRNGKIANGAVTGRKIARATITADKLAADVVVNPARPIGACGTIDQPGSYVLTGNLPDPAGLSLDGSCLLVTTDFVTIDLAGFTIAGDRTGGGITTDGTFDLPRLGITVRNGTVTNFLDALALTRADDSLVEAVRAIDNASDGITIGRRGTVTGNIANNNGRGGINGGDVITGNTVENNGSAGIMAGGGCVVTGNTVQRNGVLGISTGQGCTVLGNVARFNQGDGMRVDAGSTVTDNTTMGNFKAGLVVDAGSTLRGNTAFANDETGLEVACPSNLIGNTATFNTPNLHLDTAAGACNTADNLLTP